MGITNDIKKKMSFDEDRLLKLFPKITSIKKGKIIKNKNFEQNIVLHLPDKEKYHIKLVLSDKCIYAIMTNAVSLNQSRYPVQSSDNNTSVAIHRLISERYNGKYHTRTTLEN